MDGTQKIRAFFRRAIVVALALSALTPDALDLTLALRAESTRQAAPAAWTSMIPGGLGWSDGPSPQDSGRESNDVCPLVWPELGLVFQAPKPSSFWCVVAPPSSHSLLINGRDGLVALDPAPDLTRSPSLYSVLCRLVC